MPGIAFAGHERVSPDLPVINRVNNQPILIVNADDLGLCAGVNRGVARAHREGILTSASLLANAPDFQGGVQVAKENPELGVGVHLNIVRGRPLTPAEKVQALLRDDGCFAGVAAALSRFGREAFLAAAEREYRSQIERVLAAGIRPTHLDSEKHHCRHRLLRPILWRLAKEYGIPAVRTLREPVCLALAVLPWPGWLPALRSFWLRLVVSLPPPAPPSAGPGAPDWFFGQTHIGAMDEEVWLALLSNLPRGISEAMCHPGEYDAAEMAACAAAFGPMWLSRQRQLEMEALLSPSVKAAAGRHAHLANFGILSF